jgi:hypothetical protein
MSGHGHEKCDFNPNQRYAWGIDAAAFAASIFT